MNWKTWKDRPAHESEIIVLLPGGEFAGMYYADDGIDGLVEFEDNVMEVEEYADTTKWRYPIGDEGIET